MGRKGTNVSVCEIGQGIEQLLGSYGTCTAEMFFRAGHFAMQATGTAVE
jgi:hypothetical protein